ncbi:MAG: DedA family protein [uncultured bacterium (gcode 4)]|uniref:DedA family protein n=1 Tax=uncultured bacterium (gcode 4) TaxID=1234023 RepID=K2G3D3_9BACT|nr:MAG: DedA family protein [uncultured bacterium (gcode 4)]
MALESSIFPIPSEAVMIPAWYLVTQGKLDLFAVIFFWTLWSVIWAVANYYILWQLIWKPFLLKYWKYILIKEEDYHRTEQLFIKNDKLYTFLGRLIPVVRHLISIPAWIFKMHLGYFILITALWAWLWCAILALFWYYFGETIIATVEEYSHIAWYLWVILVCFLIYWKLIRKKAKKS